MASILDAIKILITGDGEQFREELDLDQERWDAFKDSLNDFTTSINVDLQDEDAKLKIDEVKALLDSIRLKSENIDLNDVTAREKIDEIKALLDELDMKSEGIHLTDDNAIIKIDDLKFMLDELGMKEESVHLSTEEAQRKIDELKAEMDAILFDPRIGLDDAEANRKLDELKAKIAEIHDKTVHIDVIETQEDIGGGGGGVDETGKGSSGAGGDAAGANYLLNTIMTLLPTLSPLVAALTGGVLALGSAFSAAGAGAVGFAAVAKPNLDTIFQAQTQIKAAQDAYNKAVTDKARQQALEQEQKVWAGLDGEQTKALQALQQFEAFWKTFSQEFQNPVLDVFISALKFLESALPTLAPIISSAAKGFTDLFDAGTNAFKNSDTVKSFIQFLASDAGPAIEAFGKSLGNIGLAFASLFTAFGPEAVGMQNGLVSLTKSFADWAATWTKSQGFQQFVEYVKTNGATLMQLLGNVGGLVINILKDMAPVGQVMLQAITGIVGFLNNIAKNNPSLVAFAAAGLAAYNAYRMLTPVIEGTTNAIKYIADGKLLEQASKAITWIAEAWDAVAASEAVADLLDPLTWIPLAIAAIGVLAYEIVSHWTQIKAWLRQTWQTIRTDLTTAWTAITAWFTGLWKTFTGWFSDSTQKVVQTVVGWFEWLYNHNYYFQRLVDFIRKKWQDIRNDIASLWPNIRNDISKWWTDILADVDSIFGGPVIEKIAAIWTNVKNNVGTWVGNVRTAISNEWTKIVNDAETWGENLMHMFAQGIENKIEEVASAAKSAAQKVASFLGFHSPTEDGPAADSDTWAPNLVEMFSQGLENGASRIATASQRAVQPLQNILGRQSVSASVAGMVTGNNLAVAGGNLRQLSNPSVSVSLPITIQGNVYGVSDLEKAITDITQKKAVPILLDALQQASRSIE